MIDLDCASLPTLGQADIGICGASLTGIAAALWLRQSGQTVLLVDRQAAAAWECGWTFAIAAGDSDEPQWRRIAAAWSAAGALHEGRIAGAQAEVECCGLLRDAGVDLLYYQTPIALQRDAAGAIAAVVVAGKGGLGVVRAARWIDATEDGELARLADPALAPAAPAAARIAIAWQHASWSVGRRDLEPPPGCLALRLEPGRWDSERLLIADLPGAGAGHRARWLPMIDQARRALGPVLDGAIVSHASLLPLPLHGGGSDGSGAWRNLLPAMPGRCGLADDTAAARVALGSRMAALAGDLPAAGPGLGAAVVHPLGTLHTGVAVVGTGTGGALAAIAAGRSGAAVLACDPLPCPGGIGTLGGIHGYYFGVRGGLQDEVDAAVLAIRERFGDASRQSGFHPLAKVVVLDRLLGEAGVRQLAGATLAHCTVRNGRIAAALLATPLGPLAVAAEAWIDGTGDGDLAAGAGAGFAIGRGADGMLHAFTQSSGRCSRDGDGARMHTVNYDSGYCDPSDARDLTRARVAGVLQYRIARRDAWDRPTCIAPAIGLREGRQIRTDRVLGMADLLQGGCDDDAIALHGAHLDAHAVDLHQESDELLFWIWGCRQWGRTRTACGIPYGCLLPIGLDNLWLASRCLGVSHDAHYSLRMQRDMQRIGEAAGIAAALAVQRGCGSRAIAVADIRARLGPGALVAQDADQSSPFGWVQPRRFLERRPAPPASAAEASALAQQLAGDDDRLDIRSATAGVDGANPGLAMWLLYRAGHHALPALLPLLAADARTSWRAAVVLAALARVEAVPRLLLALRQREDGFAGQPPDRGPDDARSHLARNWIAAISLLRMCAGWEALPALADAAAEPDLPFDAAVAIATTIARIARRDAGAAAPAGAEAVLQALLQRFGTSMPLPPQRSVNLAPAATLAAGRRDTADDHAWQLRLAAATALAALGCREAAALALRPLAADPRSHVRRAGTRLAALTTPAA